MGGARHPLLYLLDERAQAKWAGLVHCSHNPSEGVKAEWVELQASLFVMTELVRGRQGGV